jgi:outer membrane protein assembly factor BamB
MEQAVFNVICLLLAGIGGLTLAIWYVFSSAYSGRLRYGLAAGGGLLVVVLAASVRIEQVSGELMPRFRFRWQRHADELLEKPTGRAGSVDLATTTPEDFPQFLGPERGAVVSGVILARDWERQPPQELWRHPIGAGWSGFVAVNGFAVTMEQRGPEELVTCYAIATGEVQWVHALTARHSTVLGGVGPRGTPTIHAGRVYAVGATGVLRCLDGATGREIWSEDLLSRIGSTPAQDQQGVAWGRAGSPLIVDDLVVVPFGGNPGGPWVSLAAYRAVAGEQVWTGGTDQVGYASPSLATIAAERQIVSVNQDSVTGHRPDTGAVLWRFAMPGKSNADPNISQPVVLPNDRVLLTKGYGGGARLIQLEKNSAGQWQTTLLWSKPLLLQTKFTNVVLRGDYVYGLSDGILECVQWSSGQRIWKGGRYGPGQILGVEDLLLVQAEAGEVALVEASPAGHRRLAVLPALSGKTWNNLCLYGHHLLVRNAEEAVCYVLP